MIPKRRWKTGKQPPGRKTPASTTRWQVERCFAWMQKKFRWLVTRWERRDVYWNVFFLGRQIDLRIGS